MWWKYHSFLDTPMGVKRQISSILIFYVKSYKNK
jgi:hypothetical protein